jgi:hypothetical protein
VFHWFTCQKETTNFSELLLEGYNFLEKNEFEMKFCHSHITQQQNATTSVSETKNCVNDKTQGKIYADPIS